MVPMYKKGGKKPKSSWMKESDELKFGDKPSKKGYGGMMKYKDGGLYSAAEKAENISKVKKMNSMQSMDHQTQTKKKSGGFDLNKDGKTTFADVIYGRTNGKVNKNKTGGKSMEPGGGGRFAAMVAGFKKKGKSEDSAEAIAASIGRNKYGKKRFQEMAAAGKKGLGGMSDSTSANEAGMDMMENMEAADPGDGRKHARKIRRRQKRRTNNAIKNAGRCNRGEVCFD